MKHTVSGVGVLDKSFSLLAVVAAGPSTLNELSERSGLSRATAHRLAVALEQHGMLRRGDDGRFALGLHLVGMGRLAAQQFPLADIAGPAMEDLRDVTGESVQLYVRDGDARVCVAALESPHGLRTIVQIGSVLPMGRGSAGRILQGEVGPSGWVQTVEEREPGVASVSVPVRHDDGIVAAISVSGPIDRMGRSPGRRHGAAVVAAARSVEEMLGSG